MVGATGEAAAPSIIKLKSGRHGSLSRTWLFRSGHPEASSTSRRTVPSAAHAVTRGARSYRLRSRGHPSHQGLDRLPSRGQPPRGHVTRRGVQRTRLVRSGIRTWISLRRSSGRCLALVDRRITPVGLHSAQSPIILVGLHLSLPWGALPLGRALSPRRAV